MALTKEQKKELLFKTIQKAKERINEINHKEKAQERKDRARKLIKSGLFYFGEDNYILVYNLIESNPELAADLKNKISKIIHFKKFKR